MEKKSDDISELLDQTNHHTYLSTYVLDIYIIQYILLLFKSIWDVKSKSSEQTVEVMWFREKNFPLLEIIRPRSYSGNELYDLGIVIMPFDTTFSLAINLQ